MLMHQSHRWISDQQVLESLANLPEILFSFCCHDVCGMEYLFTYFGSSAWLCALPTRCEPLNPTVGAERESEKALVLCKYLTTLKCQHVVIVVLAKNLQHGSLWAPMKKVKACTSRSDHTQIKRFSKTWQFRFLDPCEALIAKYLTGFLVFESSINIDKILTKSRGVVED